VYKTRFGRGVFKIRIKQVFGESFNIRVEQGFE
jgi:hypothetical protein